MNKLSVKDVDLKDKKVLMRCDFNVPLDEKCEITDDTRIRASMDTINYVLRQEAALILCSHLGRPKGRVKPEMSLKPVAERLRKLASIARAVKLAPDCIGEEVRELAASLKPKEILLLENLRFHPEEEQNDGGFSKELASLAQVFVQDAFGTVHRAHASTQGVTKYLPAYAGFLVQKEIQFLGNAVNNPQKPFMAILGGAKVSSKIGVLENLLGKVDTMIIGGGMIYTFLKSKGICIGKSLVEEDKIQLAGQILEKAKKANVSVLLAVDHIVAGSVSEDSAAEEIKDVNIPDGKIGVDIGPGTIKLFTDAIKKAKTIVWNGPMGIFEIEKFSRGTLEVAKAVADATAKGAVSVIGGGDSVAAVNRMKLNGKMSHISTGGGASLEFLEGIELPGIAAIKDA